MFEFTLGHFTIGIRVGYAHVFCSRLLDLLQLFLVDSYQIRVVVVVSEETPPDDDSPRL